MLIEYPSSSSSFKHNESLVTIIRLMNKRHEDREGRIAHYTILTALGHRKIRQTFCDIDGLDLIRRHSHRNRPHSLDHHHWFLGCVGRCTERDMLGCEWSTLLNREKHSTSIICVCVCALELWGMNWWQKSRKLFGKESRDWGNGYDGMGSFFLFFSHGTTAKKQIVYIHVSKPPFARWRGYVRIVTITVLTQILHDQCGPPVL